MQFVVLQRFIREQGTRTTRNKELLAKEVLEKLSDQLVDYMRAKGQKPMGVKRPPRKENFPSAPPPYVQ